MKLSVVMEVYNEEQCLPCSLVPLLQTMDEVVVIDGSETGPSTDDTGDILLDLQDKYEVLKCLSGTYARDDGAWDDAGQGTAGLSLVTGDFVMRTAADIVYDVSDLVHLRAMVEQFPEKKMFYTPLLEFWGNTNRILLRGIALPEDVLLRPLFGEAVFVSTRANVRYIEQGENRVSGTVADIKFPEDIVYLPHVKRFHYAYVKSFSHQVEKIVKYMHRGEYGDIGRDALAKGESAAYAKAFELVDEMIQRDCPVYAGKYPVTGLPLHDMRMDDGREEFLTNCVSRFGDTWERGLI